MLSRLIVRTNFVASRIPRSVKFGLTAVKTGRHFSLLSTDPNESEIKTAVNLEESDKSSSRSGLLITACVDYVKRAVEFGEPSTVEEERGPKAEFYWLHVMKCKMDKMKQLVETPEPINDGNSADGLLHFRNRAEVGRRSEEKVIGCLTDSLDVMKSQRLAGAGLVHFPEYFHRRLTAPDGGGRSLESAQIIRRSPGLSELVFAAPTGWNRGTRWRSPPAAPVPETPTDAHQLRDFLRLIPPSTPVREVCRRVESRMLATDCTDASTWTLLRTAINYFGEHADTVFGALKLAPLVRAADEPIKTGSDTQSGEGEEGRPASRVTPLDLLVRPWARGAAKDHEVPAGTRVWFRGVPWYRLKHVFGLGHGAAAIATPHTDTRGRRLFSSADFDRLMTEEEVVDDLKLDYHRPRSEEELRFVKRYGDPFEVLEVANAFADEKMSPAMLEKASRSRDSLEGMGILPGDVHQRLCPNTLLLMLLASKEGALSPDVLPALRAVALFDSLSL
jgi:hypothetical protein